MAIITPQPPSMPKKQPDLQRLETEKVKEDGKRGIDAEEAPVQNWKQWVIRIFSSPSRWLASRVEKKENTERLNTADTDKSNPLKKLLSQRRIKKLNPKKNLSIGFHKLSKAKQSALAKITAQYKGLRSKGSTTAEASKDASTAETNKLNNIDNLFAKLYQLTESREPGLFRRSGAKSKVDNMIEAFKGSSRIDFSKEEFSNPITQSSAFKELCRSANLLSGNDLKSLKDASKNRKQFGENIQNLLMQKSDEQKKLLYAASLLHGKCSEIKPKPDEQILDGDNFIIAAGLSLFHQDLLTNQELLMDFKNKGSTFKIIRDLFEDLNEDFQSEFLLS